MFERTKKTACSGERDVARTGVGCESLHSLCAKERAPALPTPHRRDDSQHEFDRGRRQRENKPPAFKSVGAILRVTRSKRGTLTET